VISAKTIINESNLSKNPIFADVDRLPSIDGIREAHSLIHESAKNTPLIHSAALSQFFNADVWLKNETASPISCFKIRGALTDLIRCSRQKKVYGAVTSSTGNHGQGVAYAARLLDIPAHIFLPEKANPLKRRNIGILGAEIHDFGDDIDDAKDQARKFADSNEYLFVDDGESLNVIEGAGTVGLEIAQSLQNIDAVFVPMGSGSLAGGVAAAIKSLHPSAKVIAVQSDGAPAMVKSFQARKAISHSINTIADGLVCRLPALLALKSLLTFVDDAELVSDEELLQSVSALAEFGHVLVEPSGAAGLAGMLKRRQEITGKSVVLVLTGANIAVDVLRKALNFRTSLEYSA
jgi:threonine dehydratase